MMRYDLRSLFRHCCGDFVGLIFGHFCGLIFRRNVAQSALHDMKKTQYRIVSLAKLKEEYKKEYGKFPTGRKAKNVDHLSARIQEKRRARDAAAEQSLSSGRPVTELSTGLRDVCDWTAAQDAQLLKMVKTEGSGGWQKKAVRFTPSRASSALRQRWYIIRKTGSDEAASAAEVTASPAGAKRRRVRAKDQTPPMPNDAGGGAATAAAGSVTSLQTRVHECPHCIKGSGNSVGHVGRHRKAFDSSKEPGGSNSYVPRETRPPPDNPPTGLAGQELIKQPVRKYFENMGTFDGIVWAVREVGRKGGSRTGVRIQYTVRYSDGDEEQMAYDELLPLLMKSWRERRKCTSLFLHGAMLTV